MDSFTKRYLIFLGVIAALFLVIWAAQWSPAAGRLNDVLQKDKAITEYPFPFRVMDLDDGTATVSSPRSPEVSVLKFIGIAFPELKDVDGNDPRVITAQKELAEIQSHVKDILLAQPEVKSVTWEVDDLWFNKRGIYFQ